MTPNTTVPDMPWVKAAAAVQGINTLQTASAALAKYTQAFTLPFLLATVYFNRLERERIWQRTPEDNWLAYLKLATMNMDLAGRALSGSLQVVGQFFERELQPALPSLFKGDCETGRELQDRLAYLVNRVAHDYPKAIDAAEADFGFHFERQPASSKIDETDRFLLYQVLPTDPSVRPRKDGKPLLIIPPFVLGANILSFLPGENRSYAHAFANQGVPTYVRVLKGIAENEAVQLMTPEDDAVDNERFCKALVERHGVPVTLNGYCQGGFAALCDLLSGRLDGLVDAFITCVAPMDGTRSKGLTGFLEGLPDVFNDLEYGTKILPNGNRVADGNLMGWIYKLKSIETEAPLLAMWRDMLLLGGGSNGVAKAPINKTAAALNYWLSNERSDLPMAITRMSFASYNTPISEDGTLPVRLFGKPLNLRRLAEKGIRWQICYGLQDDLVEPETALAPLDHVQAEIAAFPKGHVAIATSWSNPDSAYALHTRFDDGKARGPVRFHLDLQEELDAARAAEAKPAAAKKAPAPKAAAKRTAKRAPKTRAAKAAPKARARRS